MKYLPYAAVALLSLGLGWGVGHWQQNQLDPHKHDAEQVSQRVPDFSLNDLQGQTHSPADYRGKLLLINFWATWCAPCLKEIPLLEATYKKYADQGFVVIGPALDDSAAVSAFVHEKNVSYPIMIGDQTLFSLMDAFGDTLGALPFTVLVDRDGMIVERHWGELHADQLQNYLDQYL